MARLWFLIALKPSMLFHKRIDLLKAAPSSTIQWLCKSQCPSRCEMGAEMGGGSSLSLSSRQYHSISNSLQKA